MAQKVSALHIRQNNRRIEFVLALEDSTGLLEGKSSVESVVYKKLNSTETLIQRTIVEAP